MPCQKPMLQNAPIAKNGLLTLAKIQFFEN